MDFSQAQTYLLGTVNETMSPRRPYRLERMRALLAALDNPQDRYPTIHVGGTSGKGSTSTMIAAALTAAGKRTGLHTKPHLRSMTERARIDSAPIGEEHFAQILTDMMPALERIAQEHGQPSYYETLLALAFSYFARENVDAAVIEVGIGGRLDGTNVLHPLVSIITNVGLDHTEILGDTIEQIAADKAGIAKPGVPLVSAVDQPEVRAIIEAECERAGAPFTPVLERATIADEQLEAFSQRFSVTTAAQRYDITLPVLGEFQMLNAATAILALELLPDALRPAKGQIESAFAKLNLTGRMEYFPAHPGVVFDVAHNPDKAQHLAESLRRRFPDRRFTFVVAISESKDAHAILRVLSLLPASFIFTIFDAQGRKPVKPQRLASIAETLGVWGRAIADPVEAFTVARRNAAADDVVVVTGSTFIVGQLREWWMENVVATKSAG